MTELERKALLGDQEAQKQLTESGILLPCNCGGNAIRLAPPMYYSYRVACEVCRMNTGGYKTQEEADSAWNRRPALPIGRCGECKHWGGIDEYGDGFCHNPDGIDNIAKSEDFCSYFEPKESEGNAVD